MSEVALAIEALRAKLIDLTARNPLLSFRHGSGNTGSQSALRLVGTPLETLFDQISEQKSIRIEAVLPPTERQLSHYYAQSGTTPGLETDAARARLRPDAARWAKYLGWDTDFELPPREGDSDAGARQRGRAGALFYRDELDARLRRLRSNARTAIQESGSNMLFLAFGFLQWFDKLAGNAAEQRPHHAPLILVPVSIEADSSARGPRKLALAWTGEDMQDNLSLRRKLKNDFGLTLPELADDEPPEEYFRRVRQEITGQANWTIRRFVMLALIKNAGKLLLYLDLDPDRWPETGKPADHPTVRALLGGNAPPPRPGPGRDDHDTWRKIDLELPLVDRADASQANALLRALAGDNLVIQGPPGTGKSQTIANLIAAALDQGKTVLFMSEKLAALEVVRRRLREAGLGDFCLELHSHRTRKKAFFEDIAARLNKSPIGEPGQFEHALATLGRRRTELDDYVRAIGRRAGNTGFAMAELLFEAGRVRMLDRDLAEKIEYHRVPEAMGQEWDPLLLTRFEDDAIKRLLGETAEALRDLAPFGGAPGCPWRGTTAQILAVDHQSAMQCLQEWRDRAADAGEAIAALRACLGPELPDRLSRLGELEVLAAAGRRLLELFALCDKVGSVLDGLARRFDIAWPTTLAGLSRASRLAAIVHQAPLEALAYSHDGLDASGSKAALSRLADLLERRFALVNRLQEWVDDPETDAFDERELRAAGKLLAEGGLFVRLGQQWRAARGLARALLRVGVSRKPRDQSEALLQLAGRVALDAELRADPDIGIAAGSHFRAARTPADALLAVCRWRRAARDAFSGSELKPIAQRLLQLDRDAIAELQENLAEGPAGLLEALGEGGDTLTAQTDLWVAAVRSVSAGVIAETLEQRVRSAEQAATAMRLVAEAAMACRAWRESELRAVQVLALDRARWFGSDDEPGAEAIAGRAEAALAQPEALVPWLAYERAREQACAHNCGPLAAAMEAGVIDPARIDRAWRIAWLTEAARRAQRANPLLLRCNGLQLNGIRAEYARLDGEIMEMRRRLIAVRLMRRPVPEGTQSPVVGQKTEKALLRHCIGLQRGQPAIRAVTTRAGRALQALKPCFMMGPLSVAQYLEPGKLEFDLVIMDEASQLRPEDAIGTVARGGQLIVVGDEQQMPPTSFFIANDADGAEGDGGFVGQQDGSILALAAGSFGDRQAMLNWHYRSRHPELIAFSNHEFYDNQLHVFPAPQESDERIGLTRIFVDGGWANDGVNDIEAQCVAEKAVEHLRTRPDKSLMIVAMNIKQKERIEDHIDRLKNENGGLGQILDESEADSRLEPFVVKNLENVQGDERDVVMISMTYGPRQPGGRVQQYFGPIIQQEGHRRLNVLFTRAKERMVVFTSMHASDILVGPESSRGLHVLKGFLHFVETKELSSGTRFTGKEPESPFEEAVMRELERAGYDAEPQLGVGRYRIDLAVRNPDFRQQFLLGIECDGAMYHSSLSARDRDRLRQEVLQNLGWEIERIWSTDWFRDPEQEMKRILDRLAKLRQSAILPSVPASSNLELGSTNGKSGDFSARPHTHDETKMALIALRERIEYENPDADPVRGLLRQNMLDELLKHRPTDIDDFRLKIPLHLREQTDSSQLRKYGDRLFEILDGG
jgi:very-short-patch-repair endonuclease